MKWDFNSFMAWSLKVYWISHDLLDKERRWQELEWAAKSIWLSNTGVNADDGKAHWFRNTCLLMCSALLKVSWMQHLQSTHFTHISMKVQTAVAIMTFTGNCKRAQLLCRIIAVNWCRNSQSPANCVQVWRRLHLNIFISKLCRVWCRCSLCGVAVRRWERKQFRLFCCSVAKV